jgi:hypothetical protein
MAFSEGPFPAAQPTTKLPLYKRIFATWWEGWSVIGRLFHFLLFCWVAALPLAIAKNFINPGSHSLFTNGVFSPEAAWDAAVAILWLPFAFVFASRMSGRLRPHDS